VSDHRPSRLSTDGSGRFTRQDVAPAKATRSQSTMEIALFIIFGALIILGGVALWASFSPSYRNVPNHLAAGLKEDRVNILIIGIGGSSHPGGGKDLADAVLFASLKPSTGQASVISLPRDLWTQIGRYGTHRLNQAHALGERNGYPGGGPGLMSDTVSGLLGQPVHAFVRIDFAAFEKAIDSLGGVDVVCRQGFYDYLFHDGFPQGPQHLNGKRALAFARYRYVLGPEGDNFAREQRQQQVIDAVRARVQSRSPQDIARMAGALSTLSDATQTNLTTAQLVSLYREFHDVSPSNVRHISLKPYTDVFRVTRIGEAGEAVRLREGGETALRQLAREVFTTPPSTRVSTLSLH
jgi:polyisoprenyl-teichoic acid--peptidoglycan teichoic acid transferase